MPDSESAPRCYPEMSVLVLVKKKTIFLLTSVIRQMNQSNFIQLKTQALIIFKVYQ